MLPSVRFGVVIGAVICFWSSGITVSAQQAAPTDNKGVRTDVLAVIDLAKEEINEGMTGWQMRMRQLTIEPGGYVGLHDHKHRPLVMIVREGVLTDHHPGVGDKENPAGTAVSEHSADNSHWIENKGSTPVVLLAVDIFQPH
jgi:quercetin dioxygenase-like cupin family protein